LARGVGPDCTSSFVALTSRDIARQCASTSGGCSTSPRAPAPSGKIGWFMLKVSVTSTLRSTYWRDISLISGHPIFYSAIGDDFRKTFLLTLQVRNCGNSSQRKAAAQVAYTGADDEARRKALTSDYTGIRENSDRRAFHRKALQNSR